MKPKRSHLDDRIAGLAARSGPLAGGKRRPLSGSGEIDRACISKDRYDSYDAARAVALMNGNADALMIYQCELCDHWHFSRRHK